MSVELIDLLVIAIEQSSDEQRARIRIALGLGVDVEPQAMIYTPQTLASELGRSARSIRGAIARGELDAVKRGSGWIITSEAVARWSSSAPVRRRERAPSRVRRRGPMSRALRS